MKKLTLKKTTLSRLNESSLAKVRGGEPFLDHPFDTSPKYCVLADSQGCDTALNGCISRIEKCPGN